MVLYILGNGFDIEHELNCQYRHFKKYLEANDNNATLSTLISTFPLDYEWNNFESALSNPNENERKTSNGPS